MKATPIPEQARVVVTARDYAACVRCRAVPHLPHWHHRRSRSVRDEHTHCPCNGILLCGTCHQWVHRHPFEARTSGWIVSRYATPSDEPMFAEQHGWVLLGHEGGVSPATNPQEK